MHTQTDTHTIFGLWTFVTSTECCTLGANVSSLKKRRLYKTKISYYLQLSGILYVKNNT